jgi:hypothetical protein
MTITTSNDKKEYMIHMDRGEYLIIMAAMSAASRPILEEASHWYDDSIREEIKNNLHRNFEIYDQLNESIGPRL